MNDGRMSIVVRTIATSVFPMALIFSFYVIMHGHLTPGGGFQGGAIAASAVIMLLAAYGYKSMSEKISMEGLSFAESTGAVIFVVVGFAGLIAGVSFMYNLLVGGPVFGIVPHGVNPGYLNSGGILPVLNIAVGLKVIAGLSSVVLAMILFMEGEK